MTRLDRLACSIRDLLDIVKRIRDADAGLCGLARPCADTMTLAGPMVLTVFERRLIVERTSSGAAAAMARGTEFGRVGRLVVQELAFDLTTAVDFF